MLAAQLTIATAADQRAMTFAGFMIAAATAVLGGSAALVLGTSPSWALVTIGGLYAAALMVAGGFAVWSARPGLFSIPGNEPACWHPDQWRIGSAGPFTLHQARVEQAQTLQSQVGKNKVDLASRGRVLQRAVFVAFVATSMAAIALGGFATMRYLRSAAMKPASSVDHEKPAAQPSYSTANQPCSSTLDSLHHADRPRPGCATLPSGELKRAGKTGPC